MPLTEFLSSMTDKASSAVNAAISRGGDAQDAGGQGGSFSSSRSNALANIQHQFRTLQMHYSDTIPVQRIITTQKGSVIDYDNVGRDLKAHSKELYMWGQADAPDVKDVTDRLAYLSWVQGALAGSLATAIEASRLPFKLLRDAENNLKPRRENRAGLQTAITRIENAREKGMEKRLSELRSQLKKAEAEDAPLEKEVELLRRKAIRESEETRWTAVREYGEKLVLLAEASSSIISALPVLPPSKETPYAGTQTTANARAALQRALDRYQPGTSDYLSSHLSATDLSRSESRSFGVTHAQELEKIDTEHFGGPRGPQSRLSPLPERADSSPVPATSDKARSPSISSSIPAPTPIDPAALNHEPATIPEPITSPATIPLAIDTTAAAETQAGLPSAGPTVAETGVPVTAGSDGPGPASGSLRDLAQSRSPGFGHSNTVQAAPADLPRFSLNDGPARSNTTGSSSSTTTATGFPSAEEEKRQIEREERERFLRHPSTYHANTQAQPSGSAAGTYESAEDEKKRLEREERERLLRGETSSAAAPQQGRNQEMDDAIPGDGEELPPYQDY